MNKHFNKVQLFLLSPFVVHVYLYPYQDFKLELIFENTKVRLLPLDEIQSLKRTLENEATHGIVGTVDCPGDVLVEMFFCFSS